MSSLLLLWLVTGGAVSLTIMMHFWLPDPPPPNVFTRFIEILVAGAIGGVASGYLVHSSFGSTPIVGIVASAAGGIILSGFVAALVPGGSNAIR